MVSELGETDGHPFMALFRLILVCPQKPVPPGEIEAAVAVCLTDDRGMVHPVHVGCHNEKPKDPVNAYGNTKTAAVEHGGCIRCCLENEDSQRGGGPSA